MNAQLAVDDVQRAIAHAAGTDRVEDGGADPASGFVQLFFGVQGRAGQVLARLEGGQGRGLDDAPGDTDGLGGHAQVVRVAQVVGIDQRRGVHVCRTDVDTAPAGRAQVAY